MPDIVCDFDRLADDFYGAHLIWHDANNVRYSIVPIEQHGDNRYLRLAWPAGWLAGWLNVLLAAIRLVPEPARRR